MTRHDSSHMNSWWNLESFGSIMSSAFTQRFKTPTTAWNPKQPFINGCFNWMIPNLYIGNGCFTKHPGGWFILMPLFKGVRFLKTLTNSYPGELRFPWYITKSTRPAIFQKGWWLVDFRHFLFRKGFPHDPKGSPAFLKNHSWTFFHQTFQVPKMEVLSL